MIKKIARQSSGCIAISEMQKQFIKDAYRVRSAKNLANFYPNREDYDPTPQQSYMELAGQQATFHQHLHAHNQD